MKILNVVEMNDDIILSIRSFIVESFGIDEASKISDAEMLFLECARENGMTDETEALDNKIFINGDYSVQLEWSNSVY